MIHDVLATFRERTEANAETIGALYGLDWLAVPEETLEGALVELLDPDVIFIGEPQGGHPPAPQIGIDALLEAFTAARAEWASCRYLVDAIDDEGGDILVSGRVVAEARDSDARACFRFAHVWTTQADRAVKVVAYSGPADARAALAHLHS